MRRKHFFLFGACQNALPNNGLQSNAASGARLKPDVEAYMSAAEASMQSYYAARAPEYDRVYQKPERQAALRVLQEWLPPLFAGTRLLEIACGAGFWTQFIAQVASEVVAVDAAPETMSIAQTRVPEHKVKFLVGDAYRLPQDQGQFNAAFAGFWFSHVPKERQREFITGLGNVLTPGARVVLLDNLATKLAQVMTVPGARQRIA